MFHLYETYTECQCKAARKHQKGLKNLRNTCYINSALQALFMTKEFSRELLMTNELNTEDVQIQKIFALLLGSERKRLNFRFAIDSIRPQKDATKYMIYLLAKLPEPLIHNIGSKTATICVYGFCESKSVVVDKIYDISLSFPAQNSEEIQHSAQDLLTQYFSSEQLTLESGNQYSGQKCKKLCDESKRTARMEPPENLVLSINHFGFFKNPRC